MYGLTNTLMNGYFIQKAKSLRFKNNYIIGLTTK